MPKKIPGRLVALSASAVAVIYLAGLTSTQPAANATSEAVAVATPVPVAVATSVPMATPATSASTYANGTYSGSGTSRFGNVNVSVTVAAGKIADVQITSVSTKYPASRIASLPGQVLQAQTATVNAVTGATASSQAFKQAVQQALSRALAAA